MRRSEPAWLVVGATFALLGGLLVADGAGAFDLPASIVPAIVLIGLGLALVARR